MRNGSVKCAPTPPTDATEPSPATNTDAAASSAEWLTTSDTPSARARYLLNKHYRQRRDRKALEEMADPSDRRHGTRTGYVYGCRCDRCRKAVHDEWAAFQEWRKQA